MVIGNQKIYETCRYLSKPEILRYTTERVINQNTKNSFPILRNIKRNITSINTFETNRIILETIEKKYKSMRDILVNEILNSDLLRTIVNSTEFISNTERIILENYSDDINLGRYIIEQFNSTNELMRNLVVNEEVIIPTELNFVQSIFTENITVREVLKMCENTHATKRVVTDSDNTKYVSKANLMLYTVLLRQEIGTYIETRIAEEFEKRNL